jgi:MFS family permease
MSRLSKFVRGQSSNYNVLLIRGAVTQFFTHLVQNFNNLYIVELGATPFQLSTVRSVGSVVSAMVSIPAGWLSDKYSIKKIMVLGILIQIFSVVFYALANDWTWIIVALIFATLTMTLVHRTESIFIANSLTDRNRAMGYGMRTTIIQFFSIFAPTIGGMLVHFFGGISVEGIRPLYYIQLVGLMVISIFVILKLVDVEVKKDNRARDFIGDYRQMLNSGTCLKRFAFLQSLGSLTWGMSMPFTYVYVADFKGANSLIIGYMGTCLVLVSMLIAIPLGSLADKKGRKFTIFISRPFFWASYILLVQAPHGTARILLLAWSMRGIFWGGLNAWDTMRLEMVPQEFRGRWVGFIGLIQNLIRVPAMLLGGYLYESVDPRLIFIIPALVDAMIRMPILTTVPDTLKNNV